MNESKIQTLSMKKWSELTKVLAVLQDEGKLSRKYENLFLGDIRDYLRFYSLVSAGEYKKAYNFYCDLDTTVRENIPHYFDDFFDKLGFEL